MLNKKTTRSVYTMPLCLTSTWPRLMVGGTTPTWHTKPLPAGYSGQGMWWMCWISMAHSFAPWSKRSGWLYRRNLNVLTNRWGQTYYLEHLGKKFPWNNKMNQNKTSVISLESFLHTHTDIYICTYVVYIDVIISRIALFISRNFGVALADYWV